MKKWYETNNLSSFTFEDAKEAFRKRGRVPAYLGDSLSRMQRFELSSYFHTSGHCKRTESFFLSKFLISELPRNFLRMAYLGA